METTVPFVSDDDKVEVASCFGLGSLVMSWLAHGKFLKLWTWPMWHTLLSRRSISNRGSNPNLCHWNGKLFLYMTMPFHMQQIQRVTTNKRSVSKMVVSCCETSGASARGMYMFLAGNFQRKRSYGMPYPQQGIFLQKKFRNLQIQWISAWYPAF